jgi:hypothetical protein
MVRFFLGGRVWSESGGMTTDHVEVKAGGPGMVTVCLLRHRELSHSYQVPTIGGGFSTGFFPLPSPGANKPVHTKKITHLPLTKYAKIGF